MKRILLSLIVCLMLSTLVLSAHAATNVALNQPISCTAGSQPANKANDGNRITYWNGPNAAATCTITLPSVQSVGQYIIQMPIANTFSVSQVMEVWYSTNGSQWYQVLPKGNVSFFYCDGSNNYAGACSATISFGQGNEKQVKYWRINTFERRKDGVLQNGAQLGEIILNRL